MKKYILLTQLLMLSILFVHAQEVSKPTQPEKKFCLALSAGPSFPIGKFGTRAYVESGVARPGFDLNLNF